jgi:hypothetical protein
MDSEQWVRRLERPDSLLGSLLGTYFNEDWDLDHGDDWRDVVAAFAQDCRSEEIRRPIAELDGLLSDGLSDADLEGLLLDGVHAYVCEDRFGYPTWRAWLQALRDELARLC